MKRINWIFGSAIFLLLFVILFELMNSDSFENWFSKFTSEKAAAIQSSEKSDEPSLAKNQSNRDTVKNTSYNKVDSTNESEIDLKQINNIGDSIKKQIAEIEITQRDLLENGRKSNPPNNNSSFDSKKKSKIDADKSTKAVIASIINNKPTKPIVTNKNLVVETKPASTKPIVTEKNPVIVTKPAPAKPIFNEQVKPTVTLKNQPLVSKASPTKKVIFVDNATSSNNASINNSSRGNNTTNINTQQSKPTIQLSDNAKSVNATNTSPKQSVTARAKEVNQPAPSTVYATPYQPNIKTLPAPVIKTDGTLSRKITQMEIDEFIRQFPDRSLNIQFVNFGAIDAEMENVKAQITYELSRYSYRDINKGWNQMSGYVLTDEVHFAANGPRGVIVYIPPIRNNP